MKKITFSLIMVLSIFKSVYCQYEVDLSEEFKKSMSAEFSNFLHVDDGAYYLYYKEGTGFMNLNNSLRIMKYNKNKEIAYDKLYKADKTLSSINIDLMYLKKKFNLISLKKNAKENSFDFYIKHITLDGKELDEKLIGSANYKNRVVKKRFIPRINLTTSNKKNKILFSINPDENKKDKNLILYLNLFNDDFKKEWEKIIELPYNQKEGTIGAWEVAEDGKVYFIVYVRKQDKDKKVKALGLKLRKASTDLYVYSYDPKKDELKQCDLKMSDQIIKKIKMKIDQSNNLMCSGLYGASRLGPSQGMFFAKVSGEDGSLMSNNQKAFSSEDVDFFGKHNTIKDLTNKQRGLMNGYEIDSIVTLANGYIYAIAEFKDEEKRTPVGSNSIEEFVIRGAILISKINPAGEIEGFRFLHKFQDLAERKKGFVSYSLLKTDDDLFILYNENYKNIKSKTNSSKKLTSTESRGIPVIAKLNEKNEIQRSVIFEGMKTKLGLHAAKIKRINEKEFLVFFDKPGTVTQKSKYKFGTVKIEDLNAIFKE